MLDKAMGCITWFFFACIFIALAWFFINNAAAIADFVVMVASAIWTFVSRVFNGIVGLFGAI